MGYARRSKEFYGSGSYLTELRGYLIIGVDYLTESGSYLIIHVEYLKNYKKRIWRARRFPNPFLFILTHPA